jgi:hypothetical protein
LFEVVVVEVEEVEVGLLVYLVHYNCMVVVVEYFEMFEVLVQFVVVLYYID